MMNFPIYNFDYQYTLEEIMRYLKAFQNHIVYITVPLNFQKSGVIETQHQYRDDGLLIRLYWKPHTTDIHSGFTTFSEFMNRHKKGEFKLLSFDFVRFSDNHSTYTKVPDKEIQDTFFNSVMRNRPKRGYNENEYKLLEFLPRKTTEIPNDFFDRIIEENQNKLAFELYYQDRKKDVELKE